MIVQLHELAADKYTQRLLALSEAEVSKRGRWICGQKVNDKEENVAYVEMKGIPPHHKFSISQDDFVNKCTWYVRFHNQTCWRLAAANMAHQ